MRSITILCGTVMVLEDKINISIHGLTKKQKLMINVMWSVDSKEQLYYWLDSLSEKDRQEASCLLILLKHELLEDMLEVFYTDAKEVLSKFTLSEKN
jgi:hypothetical protein